ncbi:26S protease regulatory subunit 8 [Chytridiales sp. JEL 0842]|nr:26S protease regulatory subunit 8 [Chytridiales sp. JEL 0842]
MSDYVRKRMWTRSRRRIAPGTAATDEGAQLILRLPSILQYQHLDRDKLEILRNAIPKLPEAAFEVYNLVPIIQRFNFDSGKRSAIKELGPFISPKTLATLTGMLTFYSDRLYIFSHSHIHNKVNLPNDFYIILSRCIFIISPIEGGVSNEWRAARRVLEQNLDLLLYPAELAEHQREMVQENTNDGKAILAYYKNKIEELETMSTLQTQNLRRLEAQRNQLNAKVRLLRDELKLLQEPSSYVGEVVKVMGKSKVLVKAQPEGKYIVDIGPNVDMAALTPTVRVALRNDSYQLHKILPNKVDPLVSLMMVEKVPDSTYDMVGGLDRQIKEIKEVIELPVKHPELFESLGIAQPKGVLLYGPPGTGKTLLARAVAHHTDCKFIRVSGSELVQKYIGEGSRMVRELFVMAREHAPSIIFMDEIDSIGSSRSESGGGGGGDSEVQRTMLELLNQLDGFEATQSIKVIMATNRIDILDSALLRPGRIDRKIEFPPPNELARTDILKIHSRKMNLTRGINLRKIAEHMSGASGAEVKGVCTEAGMYALRERRVHVTQEDFEMAVAKVLKKDSEQNMSIKKLFK